MTKARRLDSTGIYSVWLSMLCVVFTLMIATDAHAAFSQQRPVLGVAVAGLDFRELDEMSLSYGVRVISIKPKSPAEQAGIKVGDIITAIDDQAVFSPARLQWLAGKARAKKEAKLSLYRSGESSDLNVDLTAASREYEKEKKAAAGRSFIGIGMQPMNKVLREAFGTPAEVGVLVTEVIESSPAMKAGIKAGDVIVELAGKSVDQVSDIYRALNYFEPGETLSFKIYRDKQEDSMELTLGSLPRPALGYGMHYPGRGGQLGHPMMLHLFPGHMQGMHDEYCPKKGVSDPLHST